MESVKYYKARFKWRVMRLFQWFTYLDKTWYRNHYLGMRGFVTTKKGNVKYCYKCGNFSNGVIKMYKIFNVPICRKHHQEQTNK